MTAVDDTRPDAPHVDSKDPIVTTTEAEPTFRMVDGRPHHDLTPADDVTTGGCTFIPDVTGLSVPEASRLYRQHNAAVFPWRLVDGGKNLGAFVGRGYHQLAAAIDAKQAYELAALDGDVTGLGLSAGRSLLIIFDVDKPELCPPLLRKAIEELSPPYQTTRNTPARPGEVARGHYVFRVPPGRRMGSPTKWTGDHPPSAGWGEVRCWNSGIAVAPGKHPKPDGFYAWARTGEVPLLPPYLGVTLPEFMQTAARATKGEVDEVKKFMTRNTDPAAIQRAVERNDDGTAAGRHGATLNLALDIYRDMAAGRVSYTNATNAVHEFFYNLVSDPSRVGEPTALCEWALGQVLADAATGGVPGLASSGAPTELPSGTDVTQVNARAIRTRELYARAAGRPIGLADDIQRNKAILGSAIRRVVNSPASIRFVEEVDKHLVGLLLDRVLLGQPRTGSKPDTIAAHRATAETTDLAIENAITALMSDVEAEVAQLTAEEGLGVRLDGVRHARWANTTDGSLAATITKAYARAARSDATITPNGESLSGLSKEKQATVLGDLTAAYQRRATAIASIIGTMDPPERELVQPKPERRVPIDLDSDELRIDGVNTFLNTWCADPEDAPANGDLFIFRGAPALYTHRGGHIAERRTIKPLAPYEMIALTNDRADVHVTNKTGEVVVSELTDHQAKVGLAAVRRTLGRTLHEVATTPIITPDGTLVEDRTYDHKTGVLVAYSVPHQAPILKPTREQVDEALGRLNDFYGDVDYMTAGDEAAMWAYLFGVPLRRYINADGWSAVPALGIRAGRANAGKTLVTSAIGGLHGAVSMRLPSNEEELHKRILSAYESNQSAQVLILNNVPNGTVLDSSALAEVITESVVQGRKLGQTGQDIEHRNNKMLIVNGNRWRPSDDLVSRFIPCSLKPRVGPETRKFRTPDLQQRIENPHHHAAVLTDVLTVICGWIADGAKRGSSHGFRGNFTKWVETMDGVLAYAGITGFGENFNVFADLDESEDEDFLGALANYFGDGVTFTREQVEQALRKADRDPSKNPNETITVWSAGVGGSTTLPPPADDPKFSLLEALRTTMSRDSKAPSSTAPGLRAPLSGKKLSRMMNQQVDMPVERDGHPLVTLKAVKVMGERGWRFVRDGEAVRSTHATPEPTPAPTSAPQTSPPSASNYPYGSNVDLTADQAPF